MSTNFKTCMFGGFDRQDVISFIEKSSKESSARIEALEAENTGLREKNVAMESELLLMRESYQENAQRAQEADALLAQLEELQQKLASMETETAQLRAQAADYQSLKDHIADIEISAHRRTEEFRAAAIAEINSVADRQRAWCQQARLRYSQVNEQFIQKLQLAQDALANPSFEGFDEMEQELSALQQRINHPQE